jgi:glycosyltransferase involved in cell wall biosynthesis
MIAANSCFSFIPVDTEDTASSRIRVYTLNRSLESLGASTSLEYNTAADVLFIQTGVTEEKLEMAREAKARGRMVIYDVDDLGSALWYWVPQELFHKMVELADIVTTDTEPRRERLIKDYGVPQVKVLPDAIDYYPFGPVRLPFVESKPLRVVWFGALPNMEHFEPYIAVLSEMRDVQVVAIVMSMGLKHFQKWYPAIEFLPWSRSTFVSSLQSCQIACLVHGASVEDMTKSNNRFITSVSWGVPVIASRTPEYERTAREAGVVESLFDDGDELVTRVGALRSPNARQSYIDKAQPYVWQRYSPAAVAERFLDIVARYQ